ncbi:MAG: N-6 DNA methylase [Planctomycetota bacterium]|nr:N-6 DNA methylase [Planctomycetota bacterium]
MPVEAKPLFRPDALRPHLKQFQLPRPAEDYRTILAKWAEMLASGKADRFKEQEILHDFLTDVFCGVLGYTRPADDPDRHTISREKHVQVDGKYADAVLGDFRESKEQFIVALEGKGPKDPLDRPHAGRRMSAVDQSYRYAINLPCDWIMVTSIRETRLYHKGSDQHTYERFDTEELASNEGLLRKFVFLLAAERVVPGQGRCHLYDLLTASEKVGQRLTKGFYLRYADMRQDAFESLCEANSDESRHKVLTATQKVLDRVLFTAFCEDRGLLPEAVLKRAFEHRDPFNPRPIWENFRGLFRSINAGNETLQIPAYNGGLFADDPVIDRLKIGDDVCAYFRELGEYEYRSAYEVAADTDDTQEGRVIDVDILGHIFEQSITDLEQLRNELDGLVAPQGKEKHKTRRKKEGAFYTPAFITRYIVEQTLGVVLTQRFDALREAQFGEATGTAVKALADPRVYDLPALNKPQREALIRFWEKWQDELGTVRLVDPACGSGAFLIEAFDQLHAALQASNDRLLELRGHQTLFDLDRQILQNNLYGVDLNEEAIEICRLSLWIKTAKRGKTLTSLDHTIRVGNSVVDDPNVHPKAFDWRAGFPEVFSAGGFDVVVGNPPYIRQEWLAAYKPYWQRRFKSYFGTADIFVYFYELGVELLRAGGRLGFITSGSWVRGNFGAPLRKCLAEGAKVDSMVDFGEFQPFQGAEMIRPTITVFTKRPPGGTMRLFKWLTLGSPPANLSDVIATAPVMDTGHLGADAWELESDEVMALRKKLANGGKRLTDYVGRKFLYGVKTGLNEVYLIDTARREQLVTDDPTCSPLIRRFLRGQDIREWHCSWSDVWLICMKSSGDFDWPWSRVDGDAETVFANTYPSLYQHMKENELALKKRQDQGRYWWELRSCSYWDAFENDKVFWPDICKQPRFNLDRSGYCIGDTAFMVADRDYYLLGVLASWATWFFISKTAQPLRLRGDRWQYRLKKQWIEELPIPPSGDGDRDSVARLAERCNVIGQERYDTQENFRRRLVSTFGQNLDGEALGELNQKADAWSELSLHQLGAALKTSFKLKADPFKNPRMADEWEPYLKEKQAEVSRLSQELADADAELNDRVYRLFNLTPDEVKLLQREVEH